MAANAAASWMGTGLPVPALSRTREPVIAVCRLGTPHPYGQREAAPVAPPRQRCQTSGGPPGASGDDGWAVSAGACADLGQVASDAADVGQRLLRVPALAGGVGFVALDVDAQGGAGRAGAGEAVND